MAAPLDDGTKSELQTAGSNTDRVIAAEDDQAFYIDPKREAKLLRKLDIWIAPIMMLIFLTAYLDRANIGNAASAGMTEDLGMSGGDLGNAITLFYVTYVAGEIPCSLILKKFRADRLIPLLIFLWSIVLIGTGFMHSVGQLYASRMLLGLFESGIFPCLVIYLSTFYQRHEQALRVSYLFVSAALSGSFGGLFAYGLLHMDGVQGLEGWRWLFIIEGVASVAVAVFSWLMLAPDFEHARFLNEDDKQLMRIRAERNARYNGKPEFDWAEVRKAVMDPKLYVSCWSQFWADICSFGMSSFLPLIIRSFGYGTITTQLLTIPVFFWASIAYLVVSWCSDRWRRRAVFMIPACLLTAIGYSINVGVQADETAALYFSLFVIAPGIYIIVGLNVAWLSNTHAGYHKRSMAVGMNQSLGNCAGLVVGQIFSSTVDGRYLLGLSFSLGSVILAAFGHAALFWHLHRENKRREAMTEEQRVYEVQNGKGGDFHPDYRYAL